MRGPNTGRGDLGSFLFVQGCFVRTEFRYFLLLVIGESGVNESNHTKDKKNDSENDYEEPHTPERITIAMVCARNAGRHTPAPNWRGVVLSGL